MDRVHPHFAREIIHSINKINFFFIKFIFCYTFHFIDHIIRHCINFIKAIKIFCNKFSCRCLLISTPFSLLLFVIMDAVLRQYDNYLCRHFPHSISNLLSMLYPARILRPAGCGKYFPNKPLEFS